MAPISPAVTSNRQAFTFLEVLVALLIVGLLGTAVTGATFAALRAETRGDALTRAGLACTAMQTAVWLKESTESAVPNRWRFETASILTGVAPSQTVWQVHQLQAPVRGVPAMRIAFQSVP